MLERTPRLDGGTLGSITPSDPSDSIEPRLGTAAVEVRVGGRRLRARNDRRFHDVGRVGDDRAARRQARRTLLHGRLDLPPGATLSELLSGRDLNDGRDKVIFALADGSLRIVWADEIAGLRGIARRAKAGEQLDITVDGVPGRVAAVWDSKERVPFKEVIENVGWIALDAAAVGVGIGGVAVLAATPAVSGAAVVAWSHGASWPLGRLIAHSRTQIDFGADRDRAKALVSAPPHPQTSVLAALAPPAK